MLGIIGAMDEEICELKDEITCVETIKLGDLVFYKGTMSGKDVVLAKCGIGKVNGAICTTLMINYFKASKIFFTGVAGGVDPRVDLGDIVIGTYLVEHDFDVTAFGYAKGVIPRMETSNFPCDKKLVDLAYETAKDSIKNIGIWKGVITSGDQFVASEVVIERLKKEFNAYATEMEGASVAHVCYVFNVPCLVIRSVSDKANSDAKVDYKEFCLTAAKNSKILIKSIIEKIDLGK